MPPNAEGTRTLLLLVIEDDLDDVMRLRHDLDTAAPGVFDLVHERNPSDACRRLSCQAVDAILLDLSDTDRRDLFAIEAVLAFAKSAPVIVLTQTDDDEAALLALHAGAQEVFVKGEDSPRSLARALRHAVERQRLHHELLAARAAEAHRATHDGLTGLPNRALFLDRLTLHLQQADREGNRVGVAFVDLDHFKAVNDRLGHAAGDALLKHVGQALQAGIRAGDTVARFGGDEFAILLHDVSAHSDVRRILSLLQRRVEADPPPLECASTQVRLSIGSAVYPIDGRTPEELLALADAEMYAEKRLRHARLVTGGRLIKVGRRRRSRGGDDAPELDAG